MKKVLSLVIVFLIYNTFYSQNLNNENLYIDYPFLPTYRFEDKNITREYYVIRIGCECAGQNIDFSISPTGGILKSIKVIGRNIPTLNFIYLNENNQNNSFEIDREKIKNMISYKDIKYSNKDNLTSFINLFKNIYIIDEKNNAKKIQLTDSSSL